MREALDEAEDIGIRKSMEALADADLVLVVLDASAELDGVDRELLANVAGRAAIVVCNKADLAASSEQSCRGEPADGSNLSGYRRRNRRFAG